MNPYSRCGSPCCGAALGALGRRGGDPIPQGSEQMGCLSLLFCQEPYSLGPERFDEPAPAPYKVLFL